MKNSVSLVTIIIILGISIVFLPSCKKETEGEEKADMLKGSWTMGETTIDLTVGGVDVVQYMMDTFGYTQEQGQLMVANFTAAINNDNSGEINFKSDGTYLIDFTSGETEDGKWSINEEGTQLTLINEGESDNLGILTLTTVMLLLSLPTDIEYVDFDGDDIEETAIEMNGELRLNR